MSYRAKVYDHTTGAFLLECRVSGQTLSEAESRAIAKAALCVRGNPALMDVRHLHEVGSLTSDLSLSTFYLEGEVAS